MGKMTVVNMFFDGERRNMRMNALAQADVEELATNKTFMLMLDTITLCNSAKFDQSPANLAKEIKDRTVEGDATETAMVKFSLEMHTKWGKGETIESRRTRFANQYHLPFSSKNKFALDICRDSEQKANEKGQVMDIVYFKGAPERILQRCDNVMIDGEQLPLTEERMNTIREGNRTMMMQGQRVLGCAFAEKQVDPKSYTYKYDPDAKKPEDIANFPFAKGSGMCFLGLAALMDPPRAAVPPAVKMCQGAQIQVIMVTGDHP